MHNSPVSVFTCEKLWIKLLLTICRKKFHLQNTHLHCAYLLSHLCDHIKQSYQTYSVLPLLKNEGAGSRFLNKMNQNRVTSSKTALATLVEILGPMSVAHSGYHPSVIVSRLSCWNFWDWVRFHEAAIQIFQNFQVIYFPTQGTFLIVCGKYLQEWALLHSMSTSSYS